MSELRHGWLLEWFVKDEDELAGETDLEGATVGDLQVIFAEHSSDAKDARLTKHGVLPLDGHTRRRKNGDRI
jgi:hypothetical protein